MPEKLHTQIDIDKEKWLNKSKSGKGIYLRLSDELFLVGNWKTLKKFVNGDVEGCPLTPMIAEDD